MSLGRPALTELLNVHLVPLNPGLAQGKWSHLLLDGSKAEETRHYPLPDHKPNLIGDRSLLHGLEN